MLAYFALAFVPLLLGMDPDGIGMLPGMIYSLGVLIPSIAVGVRRLHVMGKSGWWLLIVFLPVVGGLILLFFDVQDSQPGSNEYGANPKLVN